jgi:hypothetical protein
MRSLWPEPWEQARDRKGGRRRGAKQAAAMRTSLRFIPAARDIPQRVNWRKELGNL